MIKSPFTLSVVMDPYWVTSFPVGATMSVDGELDEDPTVQTAPEGIQTLSSTIQVSPDVAKLEGDADPFVQFDNVVALATETVRHVVANDASGNKTINNIKTNRRGMHSSFRTKANFNSILFVFSDE